MSVFIYFVHANLNAAQANQVRVQCTAPVSIVWHMIREDMGAQNFRGKQETERMRRDESKWRILIINYVITE